MFVALDGLDGTGKSTQVARLAAWLRAAGREVVTCRDPGSTPLGESVRRILLERHQMAIGPTSEMLLYMAARAQLVEEVIRPALAAGQWVVSDRFLLSNVVYQGHAGGLDPAEVWRVGEVATQGVRPDVSLVLDMPVPAAMARIRRERDRMESRGEAYWTALRQGFLAEAARQPDRIVVVHAEADADRVEAAIRAAVAARMPAAERPA